MSMIGRLIVDARVQPLVIVVVKIVGHAGLSIGQVSKNGPLAAFQDLRFEARPQALGLGIIVAVAAATLRAQGLVVVQQVAVGIAAVLPITFKLTLAPKADSDGLHDVRLRRITVNRVSRFQNTGIALALKQWNEKATLLTKNWVRTAHRNHADYNANLLCWLDRAQQLA